MTLRHVDISTHSPVSFAALNESDLLECCRLGDPDAWSVLFQRYSKTVYGAAYALCHNHEDANDIVSQVFLALYRHLHQCRQHASFRKWLQVIVRNTFIDQCVRPAYRKTLSLDAAVMGEEESFEGNDVLDSAPSPEALCMQFEARRLLTRAVQELPFDQRQTISMYYTEGKSYETIAEETCVSLGTVKSRMHRARVRLRERLLAYQEVICAA